ncbi:MAG: type III pantothenate kinase [Pseudomonadota bacterium]
MTALLVDAGNSRVKWGLWSGGRLRDSGAVATEDIRSGAVSLPSVAVSRVLISNVAGDELARRFAEDIGDTAPLAFIETAAELAGVINGYRQPAQLGVDRWLALLGTRAETSDACLVVDAGTAVTIDALAADGRHLGGQILPGAPLMMASLAAGTSELPKVASDTGAVLATDDVFATHTADAIRCGARTAVIGAVEHAYRQLQQDDSAARLVLTGGDAPRMLATIAAPVHHRPDLVLYGLAVILESDA